jgi:hypothetical protein
MNKRKELARWQQINDANEMSEENDKNNGNEFGEIKIGCSGKFACARVS